MVLTCASLPPQGLAKFVRAVALGCEAVGVGLCSGEVLSLLKDWLLQVRPSFLFLLSAGLACWQQWDGSGCRTHSE